MPGVWQNFLNLTPAENNTVFGLDSEGNVVHFAYADGTNIQYLRSMDGGQTWSAKRAIALGDDVPLTSGVSVSAGVVHIVYTRQTHSASQPCLLFYRRSTDNGDTWSSEVSLDDGVTGFSTGNSRFYRQSITSLGKDVHHVWVSTADSDFTTQGINYRRSSDGGATWSSVTQPFGSAVSPGRPALSIDRQRVHIAWTDARNGTSAGNGGEVYYARSFDRGVTWQTETRMTSTSPNFKTLRPDISASDEKVVIAWQDPGAGAQNIMYFVASTNGGTSWGSNTALTAGTDGAEHVMLMRLSNVVCMTYTFSAGGFGVGVATIASKFSTDGGVSWGSQTLINSDSQTQPAAQNVASSKFFCVIYNDGTSGLYLSRNYAGSFPP